MAINNQPRSYQFWNALAATPGDFNLDAGKYGLTVATGGFTSYQLQRLMPDGLGTTYAPITAVVTVAGYTTFDLPAGQYRMVLISTAFIGLIEKIDTGRAK
jgi:hypothetical protein